MNASSCQTVFIPGAAEIDLTTRIEDGTDVAGTAIAIHHNTFRAPQTPVVIRGVPEEACDVHRNWFPAHDGPEQAVRAAARTRVFDNAYGLQPVSARR